MCSWQTCFFPSRLQLEQCTRIPSRLEGTTGAAYSRAVADGWQVLRRGNREAEPSAAATTQYLNRAGGGMATAPALPPKKALPTLKAKEVDSPCGDVICPPACIVSAENHEGNVQGGVQMTPPCMAKVDTNDPSGEHSPRRPRLLHAPLYTTET